MCSWYFNPHSGGNKISPSLQKKVQHVVEAYSVTRPWYPKHQIKLRFKGQFCYLDSSENGGEVFPLGRLRHFSEDSWSLAFYTYSNERYEPCVLAHGDWRGTIEQAISVCETYLM
jgi:hypothetical protein